MVRLITFRQSLLAFSIKHSLSFLSAQGLPMVGSITCSRFRQSLLALSTKHLLSFLSFLPSFLSTLEPVVVLSDHATGRLVTCTHTRVAYKHSLIFIPSFLSSSEFVVVSADHATSRLVIYIYTRSNGDGGGVGGRINVLVARHVYGRRVDSTIALATFISVL
jgi:hypothetical protein